MVDLIKTDLGLISKDNANWLVINRVLNRWWNILDTSVQGISYKRVGLYSYLLWIVQDVKENTPTTPSGVNLCFDDYLTLAREGELSKTYTREGQEYSFPIKYTKVYDIEKSGKEAFVKHQPTTKGKKFDDSVFDNL